jgi:hypothetical protein
MRIRSTVALGALVLALSGCVPTAEPHPIPPTPTVTPVFATEEEALAAAEAAYREYLAVSDAIAADGGANPERLRPLVTDEYFDEVSSSFLAYEQGRLHTRGTSKFQDFNLASLDQTSNSASIDAYVCLLVGDVRVFDTSDHDVTPIARRDRLPLQITLLSNGNDKLQLTRSESWSGEDFCS